ncbi:MAG: cation:proton antiporter [Deltaproteobacteria bacterium]|nr:cation:proton antiporter [Deltaproteobacteria bacterium]
MPEQSPMLSLLLITTLAAVVPLLASRLRRWRIPIVIGEIMAGIIIGKSGFNLVAPSPILDFLAEFGFVFLMFISGLEVDVSVLTMPRLEDERTSFWREPLFLAFLSFTLTLAGAFAIAFGLGKIDLVRNPFIIGLILSTTSLGIVVPVLKERGIVPTRYGQLILVTALLADVVTLMLLSVAFGILQKGFALQLILFLSLLVIFAIVLRTGIAVRKVLWLKKVVEELSTATAQIRVRGAIALMVAWATLAHALGIEVILGAFLAGVIVSIIAGPEEAVLREKLDTLGFGFFIPIFFISVGSRFDLNVLIGSQEALILLPLLFVAAYVVKVLPALVYRLAFSWREGLASGFLLSSRLSLIIAASALAFELGVISEAVNADIVLVAMITCTLSPVLFNRLAPHVAEVERKGVIIVGLNQLTALLAERLVKEEEEVAVLGCPQERANAPYCKKTTPIFGDPGDEAILKSLGADQAAACIVVLNDPEANIRVCRMAAERFGIPVIVSRADDHAVLERMKAMGVRAVQPALATVMALEGALRFPTTFDILVELGDEVEIGEARVRNIRLAGRSLRQIRLPGNALVMGIRRKGEVIVPHGDTTFRLGDAVMLIGNPSDIKEARALFESRLGWGMTFS